jgi:effector-binding domain-containing protein
MDVRLPLKSAGMCLALLLSACSPSDEKRQVSLEEKTAQFEKSLDAIQDPKLKDAVAELGGSLLLLERAQLKLDSKPVETEYGEDVLAALKHYPTPQALVDTYINGLFVLHKDSSSDYLTDLQPVFPFNFSIPASFLFPHGLEWQSVTLSNKRVIAFQPEWSETDPGIQLSPSSSNLSNPDDLTVTYPFIEGLDVDIKHQPQPVSLQGKVEVIAPRRLYTFELTKKDVGQTRTDDNLSVTLLRLANNYAEIEFNNSAPPAPEVDDTPLNPLIVQAKDTTGQFLSRSGSINETAAQIAFYQQQLAKMQQQKAWSEAFEKQIDEEQRNFEKQQNHHYTKVYFNGSIDTLDVSILDFSAVTVTRKDLNLPVRRFDSHTTAKTIQPLSLPVVVYDDQAPRWLKGATLGEEQLKKSVTVTQSVDDPSAARIEFDHPRSFNDELLGTSFSPGESPVTFFTADRNGKRDGPIELPSQAYQVDPLHGIISYDLNLFPETPAYAVGSMPLFLAIVDKQMLNAHPLPKGLELKGNALVVDQKLFPAQDWRFFAQDDTGNYLKEILSVTHDARAEGPALFAVHYFYGQPTRLETYQRTDLTTVQYGFEVKLAQADLTHLEQ